MQGTQVCILLMSRLQLDNGMDGLEKRNGRCYVYCLLYTEG